MASQPILRLEPISAPRLSSSTITGAAKTITP
jgi:hypothetical protein